MRTQADPTVANALRGVRASAKRRRYHSPRALAANGTEAVRYSAFAAAVSAECGTSLRILASKSSVLQSSVVECAFYTSVFKMQIIGVAGGIASGKSLVSEMLCQLGAERLDADEAGHEVLTEPDVIAALRERWGDSILAQASGASPAIDRRAVARIVFAAPPAGPRELAFLESISHPRITAKLIERVARARRQAKPCPAMVLDAAVMFRAGWRRYCDWLLFVEASRDTRLARALARGWSEEEFARREAAQEPVEWKRRQSDLIISNEAEPPFTLAQVRAFWTALRLPA